MDMDFDSTDDIKKITPSAERRQRGLRPLGIPLNGQLRQVSKETEDFRKALEKMEVRTIGSTDDPVFNLAIKLLRESQHPTSKEMLDSYYVSLASLPEAVDYFFEKAMKGDAIAKVQLGQLFSEGKLVGASAQIQIVAEAFAAQCELALLRASNEQAFEQVQAQEKLEKEAASVRDFMEDVQGVTERVQKILDESGTESAFSEISRVTQIDEDGVRKILTEAGMLVDETLEALRPQPKPIARVETQIDKYNIAEEQTTKTKTKGSFKRKSRSKKNIQK